MKVVRLLHESGALSIEIFLMVDEMYLQAGTQYHAGDYVGSNTEGKLYKGIFCFVIVGLQESVPIVVHAVPECTINGELSKLLNTFVNKCSIE